MASARPGASTRLVCLLGHPVSHSASPEIHAAAFAETGVDAAYLAFDVVPDALGAAVAGLRALGALGANVTVPHKVAVMRFADRRTVECEAVGAANTLYVDGDDLVADNTDATGLADVIAAHLDVTSGMPALVFGAGGAARAAAVALGRAGAAVRVRARRSGAARGVEDLARRCGGAEPVAGRPLLVVNATPLGLHGEALPADLMALGGDQAALDLVYGREPTPFLVTAARGGARALDGLPMLVAQAARSFTRWTGLEAPREAMAAAAEHAVGRPA
jgi:shikimate dehydrogenase